MPSEPRDDHLLTEEQREALRQALQPVLAQIERHAGDAAKERAQELGVRFQEVAAQAGAGSLRTVLLRFAARLGALLRQVDRLRRTATAAGRRAVVGVGRDAAAVIGRSLLSPPGHGQTAPQHGEPATSERGRSS